MRDALLVRVAQEQLERRPVGLDAVGKRSSPNISRMRRA